MPIPSLPGEKWKLIEGTNDYYISNKGRAKRGQKLLKKSLDKDGYYTVNIYGKRKRVNILVAKAFVPNPDPEHFDVVDHRNNIKTQNNEDNLQWTTRSRNLQMAHEDHLISKSKRDNILVIDPDNNMTLYDTQKAAATATGTDSKAVNKVVKGIFSQTKGFRFFRCKSFTDRRKGNVEKNTD